MAGFCPLGVLEEIHFKVVEASLDAKVVINDKGEMIVFNQSAEYLFGYDRTEVIGSPIETLIPESQWGVHKIHRETFFAEPRTREMGTGQLLEGLKRNGSTFLVQI